MAGVDERLGLDNQYRPRLADFDATPWIEMGEPDFSALKHPARAQCERTRHLFACFRGGLFSRLEPALLRVPGPELHRSSVRSPGEYIPRAGCRGRAHGGRSLLKERRAS